MKEVLMHYWIARLLSPIGRLLGYVGCLRCDVTWWLMKEHNTDYTAFAGCFPLCERCWQSLTPEGRLPFYNTLVIDHWHEPEIWPMVEHAVLAGK